MRKKKPSALPSVVKREGLLLAVLGIILVSCFLSPSYRNYATFKQQAAEDGYVEELIAQSTSSSRRFDRAYVFYASNNAYACGVLVNMARLKRLGTGLPPNVGLLLLAGDAVSPRIHDIVTKTLEGVVYKTSAFPPHYHMSPSNGHSPHYRDSFAKFLSFLLTPYQRLVFMDSDSLILRPPHHLLDLPDEVPYAAPLAYWYANQTLLQDTAYWKVPELRTRGEDFLTTWLFSIKPSKETYHRLQEKLQKLQKQGIKNVYDMDLFNIVLGQETQMLPPIYALLDSEFIPPSVQDHLPTSSPPIVHSLDDVIQGKEGWAVHFSAGMGKPVQTKVNLESVGLRYPQAHPGYTELFRLWYEEANAICPPRSIPSRYTDMKDIDLGQGGY